MYSMKTNPQKKETGEGEEGREGEVEAAAAAEEEEGEGDSKKKMDGGDDPPLPPTLKEETFWVSPTHLPSQEEGRGRRRGRRKRRGWGRQAGKIGRRPLSFENPPGLFLF